jgi:acetolactate synthase-1/2/3 large subunit
MQRHSYVRGRLNIPVACSFRRQDLLDNRHRNYVGEIGIAISPELK